MKILLLNYEFPPLGGGAANATYYLLNQFKQYKDLEIDLITSSINKYKQKKFSSNINVYYLDIGKKNQGFHFQTQKDLLIYSWKAYFKARALLKTKNYHLVHAFFGIPSGFIAMLLKKSYIVSLRGSDVPFYNPRFCWLDKLFFQYLNKIIWKKARYIIANSNDLKKLALKTNPQQKIKIIPNGVDTNFFKPNQKVKKENIILFVGRLIKRKGVSYLIEAFTLLEEKHRKSWQIWIVGDGPEKKNLIKLCKINKINKKVKFLGRKKKKELIKIYNQAKFFILPSLNEGMSNTLLEAMACGLPVITTKTGGVEQLVEKDNGLIIKKLKIKKLRSALKKFAKNKNLSKMGKESRKKANFFNWSKVAKKYLKLYKLIRVTKKPRKI